VRKSTVGWSVGVSGKIHHRAPCGTRLAKNRHAELFEWLGQRRDRFAEWRDFAMMAKDYSYDNKECTSQNWTHRFAVFGIIRLGYFLRGGLVGRIAATGRNAGEC
jgi:hypothetical protein